MMNAMKNYSGNDKAELLELVRTCEIFGGHYTLNFIYTIDEYIAQEEGCTKEKAMKYKRCDELFNKSKICGEWETEEEENEYYSLVEELGL